MKNLSTKLSIHYSKSLKLKTVTYKYLDLTKLTIIIILNLTGAIEELEHAINNPTLPSKCVTIARSLDGRLQVSHRKGLPHVIYCRIFRWPDLQSHHELKPISTCEFSFCSKQTEVCINPYHYERIDLPIHSILTPKTEPVTRPISETINTITPIQQTSQLGHFYQQYTVNATKENFPSSYQMSTPNNKPTNSFMGNYMTYTSANWSPHTPQSECDQSSAEMACVSGYQEPENWCSIVYYELNQRIGEAFNAASSKVLVDGYTSPYNGRGQRFCLGMLSGVSRNPSVEKCRKHIGRGIQIHNENGDVYLENLSESPVFVQSRNCNQEKKFHVDTVCKVFPGYSLKVFQFRLFAELLKESVDYGYDAVYDLVNMCVVKVSFVKGWGSQYYRQEVSACPCWVEVRLNGAFQWLDRVLKEMGSSSNAATSVS